MVEGGESPAGSPGERHEQLTAIAYLAAKTSRLKFLTSVMVVPHRPAVLTAKILATIDVMSGGRLIVGVGAGWLEEEFVAIGAPPFAERGTATDEYLMAFRELWTKDKPSADAFRLAGVRCIAALWRVKSLLRHRSDRPKRRLTTDQMAFVAGRHVASLRTRRHGVISDFEWTFVHFCSCLPSMQIMTRPLARFAPSA